MTCWRLYHLVCVGCGVVAQRASCNHIHVYTTQRAQLGNLAPGNMFNLLRPQLINAVRSFLVLPSRCSSSGRHVDSARRSTSYLYLRTHLNYSSTPTQLNYQYTPLPWPCVHPSEPIIHTGKENAPLSMPRQEIALPYTKIQCSAPSNPVPNRTHVNLCNSLSFGIRLLRQGIRPCRHA